MYPRKLRLPIAGFPRHTALVFVSPGFKIRARPNFLTHNRFGILTGVRVSKKSTERHRIKRLLSHITAQWPPLGIDILITAEPSIKTMTFRTLQQENEKALIKLRALSRS